MDQLLITQPSLEPDILLMVNNHLPKQLPTMKKQRWFTRATKRSSEMQLFDSNYDMPSKL